MKEYIPDTPRGAIIRGDTLTKLARQSRKVAGAPFNPGPRGAGLDTSSFRFQKSDLPAGHVLVRVLYDTAPSDATSSASSIGDNNSEANAVVQVWDDDSSSYQDDPDQQVTVPAPYGIPLIAGDMVVVKEDGGSRATWTPVRLQEVETIRVTEVGPEDCGFTDATLQDFDAVLGWQDRGAATDNSQPGATTSVWSCNDLFMPLPPGTYAMRRVGYSSSRSFWTPAIIQPRPLYQPVAAENLQYTRLLNSTPLPGPDNSVNLYPAVVAVYDQALSAYRDYVASTTSPAIAAGTQTVTPASMQAIGVGTILAVASDDGVMDLVLVSAATSTTFTAYFPHAHPIVTASVVVWPKVVRVVFGNGYIPTAADVANDTLFEGHQEGLTPLQNPTSGPVPEQLPVFSALPAAAGGGQWVRVTNLVASLYGFPGVLQSPTVNLNGYLVWTDQGTVIYTGANIAAGVQTITPVTPPTMGLINVGTKLLAVDLLGDSEFVTVSGTNVTTQGTTALTSGSVSSITIAAPGSGYQDGTYPLAFAGGGGNGAVGTVTYSGGAAVSTAIASGGTGYATAPTPVFPISPMLPTQFTATFVNSYTGPVAFYSAGVWLQFANGLFPMLTGHYLSKQAPNSPDNGTVYVDELLPVGTSEGYACIVSTSIGQTGYGWPAIPQQWNPNFVPYSPVLQDLIFIGTVATAITTGVQTLTSSAMSNINVGVTLLIVEGTTSEMVTVTGTDVTARGSATLVSGSVTAVAVTQTGSGYIGNIIPFVCVGGGGIGAAGYATVSATGAAAPVVITSAGAGYTSAPTVVFTTSPKAPSTFTATFVNAYAGSGVANTTGLSGGSGYTNGTHALGFSGGGGSGATGTFHVVGGIVVSVTITNPGSGYTSAPTITFPGAGGSGASVTAVIGGGATVIPGGVWVMPANGWEITATDVSMPTYFECLIAQTAPDGGPVYVTANRRLLGGAQLLLQTGTASTGSYAAFTWSTNVNDSSVSSDQEGYCSDGSLTHFTVPVSGWYEFSALVFFLYNYISDGSPASPVRSATAGIYVLSGVQANQIIAFSYAFAWTALSDGTFPVTLTGKIYLTAGAQVIVACSLDVSGTVTVPNGSGGGAGSGSFFRVKYLGSTFGGVTP
jgi:hypothetical protein